jgi:hypothetical protein
MPSPTADDPLVDDFGWEAEATARCAGRRTAAAHRRAPVAAPVSVAVDLMPVQLGGALPKELKARRRYRAWASYKECRREDSLS